MAIRSRNLNKRQALSNDAQKWLAGDKSAGMFAFQHDDVLGALFAEHGTDSMFWRRGMRRPITLEELEANEDAWLCSGDDD